MVFFLRSRVVGRTKMKTGRKVIFELFKKILSNVDVDDEFCEDEETDIEEDNERVNEPNEEEIINDRTFV